MNHPRDHLSEAQWKALEHEAVKHPARFRLLLQQGNIPHDTETALWSSYLAFATVRGEKPIGFEQWRSKMDHLSGVFKCGPFWIGITASADSNKKGTGQA